MLNRQITAAAMKVADKAVWSKMLYFWSANKAEAVTGSEVEAKGKPNKPRSATAANSKKID